MSRFRLLPLVAFAALCLFGLKLTGLIISGGYTLSGAAPASAQSTEEKVGEAGDGGAPATKPAPDESREKTGESSQPATSKTPDDAGAEDPKMAVSRSELAVLKSLVKRRNMLKQRERELELRENLLEAAEKRVKARIGELKAIEDRIETQFKSQDVERDAQLVRLAKVYSSMKAKSAARIFNRLDINVLLELVKRMQARATAAILAAMEPVAAQRLTLGLAKQNKAGKTAAAALPKINSRSSQ